jgi:protein TonB
MIEEDDPAMDAFVPVEKLPMIVVQVQPAYPEFARRGGISGFVWLKVLVGKDGKPKRAIVLKEESGGLFNESAIEAAMQYVFTPGMMNSGPVSVWVTLKFRFQLKGEAS